MKNRNWCFTAYTEPKIDTKNVEYYVYKPELCPKTKKLHYQGYIEFDVQKRMNEVKIVFNDNTLHVEIRHGTQKQAIDYCKKEETKAGEIVEWGKPKRQGSRSDLDAIWEAIDDGHTSLEILREFKGHALKHINMIEKGMKSRWGCIGIDAMAVYDRRNNEENPLYDPNFDPTKNASKVGGNTEPPTVEEVDEPIEKTVKEEVKDLKKSKKKIKKAIEFEPKTK
jgi:hypothetical protein